MSATHKRIFAILLVLIFALSNKMESAAQTDTPQRIPYVIPSTEDNVLSPFSATADELATALDIPLAAVSSASIGTSDPLGTHVFTQVLANFPTFGNSFAVISSGNASQASNPNDSTNLTTALTGLDTSLGNDLVQLTLVLNVPTDANYWAVDWRFFSEEYPNFVGGNFNDIFLIETPSSSFTISGNQITAPDNVAFDPFGDLVSINTTGVLGMSEANAAGTTYNGGTGTLTTVGVIPDGTSQITLVFSVMDIGDSSYDTTVFLDNFRFDDLGDFPPPDGTNSNPPAFNRPPTPDAGTEFSAVTTPVIFNLQATDPNPADIVTINAANLPSNAVYSFTPGNPGTATFSWTPNASQAGSHQVSFIAVDDHGYTSELFSVVISVPTVNLTALNDSYSLIVNKTLNVPAPGVMSNDTGALTTTLVTGPSHAQSFSFALDGSFSYTPQANYIGSDSFTYIAHNYPYESAVTTVSLTISNPAPVAQNDSYTTAFATALNVPGPGVLANDTDTNNDVRYAVLVTPPSMGALTLNADGSFSYVPPNFYYGTTSFTYRVREGTPPARTNEILADSNIATVSITVARPQTGGVPTNLIVDGNLTTGSIFPTFHWFVPTNDSGQPFPTEWYQLLITDGNGNTILELLLRAEVICSDLFCTLTLSDHDLPAGLLNGDYIWKIRFWNGDAFSEWSEEATFSVNVPAPQVPSNIEVTTGSGDTIISFDDDPNAAWFHFIIKDADGNVLYDGWHQRSELVCDGSRCTFVLKLPGNPDDPDSQGVLLNGSYSVSIQAWGAGGFNGGSDSASSPETSFEVNVPLPGELSSEPADYYLTHTNTGSPTFGFIPAENSTWTLLLIAENNDGVYSFKHLRWYRVSDMNCPTGLTSICFISPQDMFLPVGDFEWWMIGWGPAGFSTGGFSGWVQSPFNVNVQAELPGLVQPQLPDGTINNGNVVYQWNHLEGASWYQIWVGSAKRDAETRQFVYQTFHNEWYRASDIGCLSGVCSINPDVYLPDDTYRFYLQAYNPAGVGDWNLEYGEFKLDRAP